MHPHLNILISPPPLHSPKENKHLLQYIKSSACNHFTSSAFTSPLLKTLEFFCAISFPLYFCSFSIFVASNLQLASLFLQTFVHAAIFVLSSVLMTFKIAFHRPSFRYSIVCFVFNLLFIFNLLFVLQPSVF